MTQGQVFENPHDYAVLVGINHYAPGIRSLSGPPNDCDLFRRWLIEPSRGGLDPDHITTFLSPDPFASKPNRADIEGALIAFFNKADADPGWQRRRLYLFFSGHGASKPASDQSGTGAIAGTGIITGDALPNILRGLTCQPAAEAMRLTQLFQQVVLIVDCCAEVTGQPALGLDLPRYGDPTIKAGAYLYIQAAGWGTATHEDELADPINQSNPDKIVQGVLTNALLNALMSADDGTGQVTAESVKKALKGSTINKPKITLDDDGLPGSTVSDLVFGKPIGLTVNITTKPGTQQFQVRDGSTFGVVIAPRPGPDTIRLKPGMYRLDGIGADGTFVGSEILTVRDGGQNVSI